MQPPRGMRVDENARDQSIVTFVENDMSIRFFVRSGGGGLHAWEPERTKRRDKHGNTVWEQRSRRIDSPKKLTRKFLRQRGRHQLAFVYPSARELPDPDKNLKVGGQKATKLYFLITDNEDNQWVGGQAYVILGPRRVAVFQLECDKENWRRQKQRFEAMLRTVEIAEPDKLTQQRSALLEAGQEWRQSISVKAIKRVVPESQWYRVMRDGEDVGYMRLRTRTVTYEGKKGLHLHVQKRMLGDEYAYDSRGEYFASFEGHLERWDLKTTRRPREQAPANADEKGERLPAAGQKPEYPTWVETGVVDDERIIVIHELPTRLLRKSGAAQGQQSGRKAWPIPPKGYLSQIGVRLFTPLLPHDRSQRMLFYAYDSQARKIALRRVQVQPLEGDRFAVRVKPTPTRGERVSIYRADGTLIKRRLPDGRVIRPATADELRQAWNLP
jgi:hypothetical protein